MRSDDQQPMAGARDEAVDVWGEDLAGELPPLRDDEPPTLRQDILDELSDHLTCALHRELLGGHDESGARRRVLERFGNVRRLARQLWWAAMKEKIMAQRILLIVMVLVAAACLGACGMTWRALEQSRASTAAFLKQQNAQFTQLLESSRTQQAALLKQMTEQLARQDRLGQVPAVRSPEWNPLAVKLLTDAAAPEPVSRALVKLSGRAFQDAEDVTLVETTDSDGAADFGMVRPGRYYVNVEHPWGESLSQPITVRPGTAPVLEIVCPAEPRRRTSVSLQLEPGRLAAHRLAVLAQLQTVPRVARSAGGKEDRWSLNEQFVAVFGTNGIVWCGDRITANTPMRFPSRDVVLHDPRDVQSGRIEVSGRQLQVTNAMIVELPEEFDSQVDQISLPVRFPLGDPRVSRAGEEWIAAQRLLTSDETTAPANSDPSPRGTQLLLQDVNGSIVRRFRIEQDMATAVHSALVVREITLAAQDSAERGDEEAGGGFGSSSGYGGRYLTDVFAVAEEFAGLDADWNLVLSEVECRQLSADRQQALREHAGPGPIGPAQYLRVAQK